MCLPRIIELTYTQSQAFAPRHLAHWRPESSLYPVSKSSLAPGVQSFTPCQIAHWRQESSVYPVSKSSLGPGGLQSHSSPLPLCYNCSV